MSRDSSILIGYNRDAWEKRGLKIPVNISLSNTPMLAFFGNTGSGKTVAVKTFLGHLALQYGTNVKATICDFKNFDFKSLEGAPRYHSYLDMRHGLENYYNEFQSRLHGNCMDDFIIRLLVLEEWSSYINTISGNKKLVESEKAKLSALVQLGRAWRTHVLVCQQRMDVLFFGAGARDQFSVTVAMGNISRESAQMFGFERDTMLPAYGVGEGHVLINSVEQIPIKIPIVRDFQKLDDCIQGLVQ